jgi:hypothetical protein
MNSGRSSGDPSRTRFTARDRRTSDWPVTRAGWSATPARTTTAAAAAAAAAMRNSPDGRSHTSSRPPSPYPVTCMPPTAMLMAARPNTKLSLGRMSETSASIAPPVAAIAIHGSASSAKRAPQGIEGSACSSSAAQVTTATMIIDWRGRSRSAAEAVSQEAAS